LNRANDGLVGRIDDFKGLAIYGLDPLIVDEAMLFVSDGPEENGIPAICEGALLTCIGKWRLTGL
jgi:hypothetical protein